MGEGKTMNKEIEIHPVTRIEGHAKITIHLNKDDTVKEARFHVIDFRGFEKFSEGRPFYEMPGITSRSCGICPVSHCKTAENSRSSAPLDAHGAIDSVTFVKLLPSFRT
jgi:coenzyme F420-reducing hydrogenase alpha subunit